MCEMSEHLYNLMIKIRMTDSELTSAEGPEPNMATVELFLIDVLRLLKTVPECGARLEMAEAHKKIKNSWVRYDLIALRGHLITLHQAVRLFVTRHDAAHEEQQMAALRVHLRNRVVALPS